MLVTVATYPRVVEAKMAQERLLEEGIEAVLEDEPPGSIMVPRHTNALGGVRLQVAPKDEAAAVELLELDGDDEEGDGDDGPGCPRCASPYLEFSRTLQQWVVCVLTLGVALPFFRKQWHCGRCAFSWDGPPPSSGASAPVSRSHSPYRRPARGRAERQPRASFRFPQTRADVGTFFGLVVGLVGWMLFPEQLAGLALLLLGAGLGWLGGRLVVTHACSACRRAVTREAKTCACCRAEIRGAIRRQDDHFRALADLEVADARAATSERKKSKRTARRLAPKASVPTAASE